MSLNISNIKIFRFFLSVCLIVLFGLSSNLSATHIVGGEVRYQCLGGNRFLVQLTLYRDCDDPGIIPFDVPALMNVFDRNGNLITSVGSGGVITLPIISGPEIIDFPPVENCEPNFQPVCVERAIYQREIFLPFRAGGYTLVHQRCCRNGSIINLIDPVAQGSTYTATISEAAYSSCNSSPVISSWPPIYVCAGRPLNINQAAIDPNGDSISYKLTVPFSGASIDFPQPGVASPPPYDNIVYRDGYTIDWVLGNTANPLRIDPITGLMTGIPEILGQFLVGILIEEWRNGQLISTYIRDFQLNVVACGSLPVAKFSSPDIQCGNLTVDFINESENATYYEWFISGEGLDDSVEDVVNLQYVFPDTGTYTITLVAFDEPGSACTDTFTRTLILRETGLELSYDIQKYKCGEFLNVVLTDLSTDSISQIIDRNWEITYQDTSFVLSGQSVSFQMPYEVDGTVTLTIIAANGCTLSETFDFTGTSDEGLFADFETEIIKCEEEYRIRPIDLSKDDEGDIVEWIWIFTNADGVSDTLFGQIPGEFLATGFQNVSLSLFVVSSSGCEDFIEKEFPLIPTVDFEPKFSVQASECEDRLVIDLIDESYSGPEGAPVRWNWLVVFESGDESGEIELEGSTVTIEFDTTAILTITLCVTYELDGVVVCENACFTKEGIFAHLLGPQHFESEVTICVDGSIELNPNPLTPNVTYQWSPATGLSDPNIPNPIASPDSTTLYTVIITSTDINCGVTKEVLVSVIDGNDAMDFTFDNECGSLTGIFTGIDGDPSTISGWDFGDGNTGPGESPITHTYSEPGTYTVTMITMGECPMEISKEISVRFIDLSGLQDTIVNCDAIGVELFPGAPQGFQYVWTPDDNLTPSGNVGNPTANVSTTTTFNLVMTDINDPTCIIERSVTVIIPDPIVLDVDDIIDLCEPQEIVINAESPTAVSYTWTNGQGTVIGTGPRLEYTPQIDEIITVTVVDEFGCELTKSVSIEFFKVVFTTDGNNPMCLGDVVNIEVGSPDEGRVTQYRWEPANLIIAGADTKRITVSPEMTTTYIVQIAYDDGCILTASFTQQVALFPVDICDIDIEMDTIFINQSTRLCVQFNPNYQYIWEPAEFIDGDNTGDCINTTDLEEDVVYSVTIINEAGCEIECTDAKVTVANLICDEPYIFVPNTFSPNNDGVNDVLRVRVYEEFLLDLEFVIYNRWGQEVFKTTDISVGWDGTFKGEQMPVDSYGFYLRVGCIDGEVFKKSGSVNLLK